jgi:hypothetical protein
VERLQVANPDRRGDSRRSDREGGMERSHSRHTFVMPWCGHHRSERLKVNRSPLGDDRRRSVQSATLARFTDRPGRRRDRA